MVYKLALVSTLLLSLSFSSLAQTQSYDSLVKQLTALETEVDEIQLNLETSKNKFKTSILIASLGYATTIAGGLMLGRKNDELGQGLLVVGGVTGTIGTYKMVDAFQYLTGKKRKRRKENK